MISLIGHTHMPRSAVGVRINGHAFQPQFVAGANHAHSNLAAIGD
jgi:hypothetical protein